MAKVFLDIGGYLGDSVHAALDPVFGFDCVYTFEPVESLAKQLCGIGNSRLTVIHAGMIDATGKRTIYHAGTLAGSIYADAPRETLNKQSQSATTDSS